METFSALLAICAGNSPVPMKSPHKGQWLGALMYSLICAWINDWVNNREAGGLRRNRVHYDVTVMRRKLACFRIKSIIWYAVCRFLSLDIECLKEMARYVHVHFAYTYLKLIGNSGSGLQFFVTVYKVHDITISIIMTFYGKLHWVVPFFRSCASQNIEHYSSSCSQTKGWVWFTKQVLNK